MKKTFRITLSFLILCASFMLHSEVRIEITRGVDSTRPLAVVPFKLVGSGLFPEDIGKIICADLRNSGKFNPVAVALMPQKPTIAYEVIPESWSKLGINTVVLGQVQHDVDGSYLISYQLVDTLVTPGSILMQNHFKVTAPRLRYAAHAASDEIFEKLVGIKGAFRTRIAYIAQKEFRKHPYELRVADYDGHNQFVVQRSSEPLMSPSWSQDGNALAYVTFESGRSALVLKTLNNGNVRQIAAFPRHNGSPAFSPDGSHLAFALSKNGSLNLYVMNLVSGQVTQITDTHNNSTEPDWFPDSQTIAYTSDQGGRPQIYKISINGGTAQRLTIEGSQNQNAQVSSDGKFLVIVNSSNGIQRIAKQDLNSGSFQILTDTFLDETPTISPNGIMIMYSSIQSNKSILQLVSTNGKFKMRFPADDEQVRFPSWSPYL